jgi:cyanophycin synthetase
VEDSGRPGQEVRTVYNTVVTELLCPSLRETAERAAQVLGSDLVGVDVITTDPSRPLSEAGGCVNEVNTTPALHHHYDPHPEHLGPLGLAAEVLDLALLRQAARRPEGPVSRSLHPPR